MIIFVRKKSIKCMKMHVISYLVAIGEETSKIDSDCSLEKEFTELICMNP